MVKYSGLQIGLAGASLALASSALLLLWLVKSKKVDNEEPQRNGDGSGASDEDTTPMDVLEFNVDDDEERVPDTTRVLTPGCVTIVHASVTGTTAAFAKAMMVAIETRFPRRTVQLVSMNDLDWWDELLNNEKCSDEIKGIPVLLVFLPTYTNGSWTPNSGNLKDALDDLRTDWRIEKFPLRRKLRVAVFGMGSSEYDDDTMGKPAREAVSLFNKLGAKVAALAVGDDATANHANEAFKQVLLGRR
jgi:Flavodoxin